MKFAPDDFVLLSPDDPRAEDSGIASYLTNAKRSTWYFCKTCGVRCFTVRADTEDAEVEVRTKSIRELDIKCIGSESGETVKIKAWKLKKEGFREGNGCPNYFSVNAVTLNPMQEGLDLALFHKNQWIAYVDSLEKKAGAQVGKPHIGGIY